MPRGADQIAVERFNTGQWTPPPHGVAERRMLAVDPGDVHVGVAEFAKYPSEPWRVTWAGEMTPDLFLDYLAEDISKPRWDLLVVEEWRLFPGHAPRAVGSDMPTARLIGSIQALVRYASLLNLYYPIADFEVDLLFQSPQIKVPTRSLLKRRKLKSVAKLLGVTGDHATDAELHGYHYLVRTDQPVWNSKQQEEMYYDNPRLTHRHSVW